MVKIYTSPGSQSSRKAINWFKENNIPYNEKNIVSTPLEDSDILEILNRSENGTEDFISTRSKVINETKVDIDSMSLNELMHFIKDNPTVLKRPIMIDDRRFQVGYNAEEIRSFIPR